MGINRMEQSSNYIDMFLPLLQPHFMILSLASFAPDELFLSSTELPFIRHVIKENRKHKNEWETKS